MSKTSTKGFKHSSEKSDFVETVSQRVVQRLTIKAGARNDEVYEVMGHMHSDGVYHGPTLTVDFELNGN